MRRRRFIVVAAMLSVALVACGSDKKTPAQTGASKVTVKTSEYKFDVASSLKGGLVELTLDNSLGKESHEAEMIRLDAGKTIDDVKAALDQDIEQPLPDWAHFPGSPGPILPGATATYTGIFPAGTYVFVCHVPAPDGKAHYEKGMITQIQIGDGPTGPLPASDVTIEATDITELAFVGLEKLRAGSQKVRFVNRGELRHNMGVIALAPGKRLADFLAFFGSEAPQGPPPFTGFPGFIATTDRGLEGVRTLDLSAGTTYAFVCFVVEADGAPHLAKGMAAELTAK